MTRPTVGHVYYAPTSPACEPSPLVPGIAHGVIVDDPSQDVAVVYTTRERAESAMADPAQWHPDMAARYQVRAIAYTGTGAYRFVWADGGAW